MKSWSPWFERRVMWEKRFATKARIEAMVGGKWKHVERQNRWRIDFPDPPIFIHPKR